MQHLADAGPYRWQGTELLSYMPSLAKSSRLPDLFLSHRKVPSSPTQKRDAALRELHCVPDMASRAW